MVRIKASFFLHWMVLQASRNIHSILTQILLVQKFLQNDLPFPVEYCLLLTHINLLAIQKFTGDWQKKRRQQGLILRLCISCQTGSECSRPCEFSVADSHQFHSTCIWIVCSSYKHLQWFGHNNDGEDQWSDLHTFEAFKKVNALTTVTEICQMGHCYRYMKNRV